MTELITKSAEAATDVAMLIRARHPLLWIVTQEEARVEGYIIEAALAAKCLPRVWDVAQGVVKWEDKTRKPDEELKSPDVMLGRIALAASPKPEDKIREQGVWILRDLPIWLEGLGNALTLRQLRNLSRTLPTAPLGAGQTVIVLSPSGNIPPELAGSTTVIEWPLPDREEVASLFDDIVSAQPAAIKANVTPKTREAAIDAAMGLTGEEAEASFAKSLVQFKRVDPAAVNKEKRRIIARDKVLEWCEPLKGGLDSVGGLNELKTWLVKRNLAYSPEARKYGLPSPKGVFLAGVSGCGKSHTAKATAAAYAVPLLRCDLGALKSKFVGDSEANLRKMFRTVKAIGRCVLWFDEIEKALAGAVNGGADGGVSSDALGAILTWMAEDQGEAFVVATANDITGLPPEFLRKGRFDELFFIDLPNPAERVEILKTALKFYNREKLKIDFAKIVAKTDQFTGSEIAELVKASLFTAFADEAREPTTNDLISAASEMTPLSETAKDKIRDMREWGKKFARPATSLSTGNVADNKRVRLLDVEG
jgi:AAA+ superfamily predicted ATPase